MPPYAGRYRVLAPKAVMVEWRLGDGSRLLLAANFSEHAIPRPAEAKDGRLLYSSAVCGAPVSASFFLTLPAAG
jgi:hypothetical protein